MKSQSKSRTSLRLLTPLTILLTILVLWPSSAVGQTTCKNSKGVDGVCVTRQFLSEEVGRGVTKVCAESTALAKRVGEYRLEAKTSTADHNACVGRLHLLEEQLEAPKVDPFPSWLAPLWTVAAVGTSAAAGACVASGCPRELNVGLLVGAAVIGAGKLVFEIVR